MTPFMALDLAFLAAAATVGIYVATARLTFIGWLFQYRDKLQDREFVRWQIRGLSIILFFAFVAGSLAVYVTELRANGNPDALKFEECLYGLWIFIIFLLLVFHFSVFFYRLTKKCRQKQTPQSVPTGNDLATFANRIKETSEAFKLVTQSISGAIAEIDETLKSCQEATHSRKLEIEALERILKQKGICTQEDYSTAINELRKG